jgi:uncharacterized membrane protein YdjX (TVP38/TMEM64 family)
MEKRTVSGLSRRKTIKWSHALITLVTLAVLGVGVFLLWPHLSAFTNPDEAKRLIGEFGPLGPLVFMALQVLQVFIAPIPGQVTGLVGGYLFGPWLGLLYALIGATIGFTLIFLVVRRLGRPFVERFVDKKTLEKFDYIAGTKGVFVLFLVFLLPAFPDDLICYIAGLTKIPIRTLVLVSIAGRLPVYAILSFTGQGLAESNLNPIAAVTLAMVVLFGLGLWKRVWLQNFVRQEDHMAFLKRQLRQVPRKKLIGWMLAMLIIILLLVLLALSPAPIVSRLFGS